MEERREGRTEDLMNDEKPRREEGKMVRRKEGSGLCRDAVSWEMSWYL